MRLVTVEQMAAIERETDAAGVSYAEMMENAGRAVAQAVLTRWEMADRSVLILVGPGNNGGDGLVAGYYLAQASARVVLYLSSRRSAQDANYARVIDAGLPVVVAADDADGSLLHEAAVAADVVIDALLGTGVDRPIDGALKELLERCRRALQENRRRRQVLDSRLASPLRPSHEPTDRPLVVAIDCPTGLNCDTGAIDPVALPADMTVTFAAPKLGHYLFPGAAAVGELLVADIGAPQGLAGWQAVTLDLATADEVRAMLPQRPLDAHKGTFGKLLIVAGSVNYVGAAALAGQGACRAGAGLVTVALPGPIHGPVAAQLPEATYLILPNDMGAVNENAVQVLLEAIEPYDAMLVGPGLGRDEKTRLFVETLFSGMRPAVKGRIGFFRQPAGDGAEGSHSAKALPPLVVDADGLNLLAELDDWVHRLPANSILTPHPGEMARLRSCSSAAIQADRIGVTQQAAGEWGHVVVLKGAFSVVAAPNGRTTVIPYASPALATAGSGDVLAGVVAALLGQGLAPYPAAVAGAFLHAAAGGRAAESWGRTGVAASDLPTSLAAVLADWGL